MAFKRLPIFTGTTGLNNVVDPARVEYNPQSGVGDLVRGVNVKIGASGDLRMREGFLLKTILADCHSLYSDGVVCLFVADDDLYQLNKDYTKTGLRSGLTVNAKMRYVSVGGIIYYTNGYENGFVVGGVSYPWIAGTYTGYANIHKFSSPPVGKLLEVFSGRMYIAKDNTLWYSEPFAYSWFDLSKNFFMFSRPLRFIRAVEDGIYIGSDEGVDLLQGMGPQEFMLKNITTGIPVEGTDTTFNGSVLGKGIPGKVVSWTGSDGIWAGMGGGNAANLTTKKLVLPSANYGSSVVYNKYMYALLQE